jgi:transcriptional regulator
MGRKTPSILYGDLDLIILRILSMNGPLHGFGLIEAIDRVSESRLQVEDGALYRSLHRLEKDGLLSSEWRISEKNRKARYYQLTSGGREELQRAQTEWASHTRAMARILGLGWEVG